MVIVIAGLLAVYALPRFFNRDSFEDRGAYTEILSAVRYAQQLAVAINCNTRVALTANTYTVTIDDNPVLCNAATFGTPAPDPVTRELGFSRTVSIAITPAPTTLTFTPLGRLAAGTADTTITAGGYSFTVISDTGFIQGAF